MKIKLKVESWGNENRNLDLEVILGRVPISMSTSEIEPALEVTTVIFFCIYLLCLPIRAVMTLPVVTAAEQSQLCCKVT